MSQPTRREALLAEWDAEVREHGLWTSGHSIASKMADLLREEPYERNGIRHGERVVCVDVPRLFGTVIRCAPDGVDVRWDDGKLGELVWRDDAAYNAFRLQVVRADLTNA